MKHGLLSRTKTASFILSEGFSLKDAYMRFITKILICISKGKCIIPHQPTTKDDK
jgi:hypothetical protein